MKTERLAAHRTVQWLSMIGITMAFLLAACQPAAAPAPAPAKPAEPAKANPTAAPKASQQMLLTWSSTSATSANYAFGVKTSEIINKYVPEVQVTVTDSSGGPQNVVRHKAGQAQLSHMTTDQAYLAAKAQGPYAKDPYDKIRNLIQLLMNPMFFAVREDSGVKNFKDLQGKKFSPGFAGSATNFLAKATLEAVGVKIEAYEADLGDAVGATKDGRIIGFVKSGQSPDANLLDVASATPIRLVEGTKEELEAIKKGVPYAPLVSLSIKGGTYRGIPNDMTFENIGLGLFIGSDTTIPQETGYKMVKAVWEHWKEGMGSIKGFENYDALGAAIKYSTVPLHAGTIQYLKEIGKPVPDNLVPPEYKAK